MSLTIHLILVCGVLALLTFAVGIYMLLVRIQEMKKNRIHPQATALSAQRAERLQDSRVSDNYNHLFELPVLFYALCALAIASQHIPAWLPVMAWLFVIARVCHTLIQCTYNKVMHRFYVFLIGFFLLTAMWLSFLISYFATGL